MSKKPFTLRKLLAKLPKDELEKFMDVPLQAEVQDPWDNVEFVDIEDAYPNRREPNGLDSGRFALLVRPRSALRKNVDQSSVLPKWV